MSGYYEALNEAVENGEITEKEIIVKEYRNEKGLIARREIGEEIVRCKECKWHDNERGFCHNPVFGDGNANYMPPITEESDYCSQGKEQEHE